jgi:DNA-binding transcriptional LysR family regulator
MDIRLLEAFRAVVESGSVTHAASSLGITQPAVSAQIARLESEIGFSLFTRTGNRLRLTSEAVTFRAEVERTLDRIDDLGRAAEHIRLGQVGSLTVASHPMAGVALLPPVIAAFVQQRPNVRVQLFTRNSDLVRGMFPSRTIDIGIAELPIDPTGLNVTRYRMECVAVLPKDHALCAHKIITPKLMSGLPFVGMSREWAAHHLVNSVFAEAAAHLNVVVASELFAMICELVANGVGVSIVDPASARQFQAAGLAIRPFRPLVPYDIAIFHAAEQELSLIGRTFLKAFDAHLQGLIAPTTETDR